jgi:hypothetical protein
MGSAEPGERGAAGVAVGTFLETISSANTRRASAAVLDKLADEFGPDTPTAVRSDADQAAIRPSQKG